ncbi:MAG: homoserine kinase [Acidimicrobiales bacterium]
MFARAPASSANLGPGFDALAVALELYVEVSVEPAAAFSIETTGAGAGRFDDENHLAAVVARRVLGHGDFALRVDSAIPLSRGLGSSAALALAAAAAAGAGDPLTRAVEVDGHGENAAASRLGGLVVVGPGNPVMARSLALDTHWRFVVVVPDQELATRDARAVLPRQVPFADAVANLSALGLLIAGLAHHEDFVAGAMDDALHQPYRSRLLPFADPLLAALREAGAAGSCWSGAGSAMLALVDGASEASVAQAGRDFLVRHGVPGTVLALAPDRTGLVTR